MKITKMNTIFIIVSLMVVTAVRAQEDTSAAAKRSGLLQRRNIGRPGPLNKITSTTTTSEAPEYENQEGDAEYDDEQQEPEKVAEAVTTTSEAPKKLMLIRPFRSNDDLLATLKKRRAQAKADKTVSDKHEPKQEEYEAPREHKPKTGNLPTKKRFGPGAGAVAIKPTHAKAVEPIQNDDEPSVPAPISERVGRSKFAFNRPNKP